MRTTLREKAVLWVNGLGIAIASELVLRGQIAPLSLAGAATIIPLLIALLLFTSWMLSQKRV